VSARVGGCDPDTGFAVPLAKKTSRTITVWWPGSAPARSPGEGVKGEPVEMRSRLTGPRASWLLPAVLSTTAGAVDVIGFLAFGGLFTAHISGNLCVVAAHYITGRFSQAGPLLSVPVFIAVLWAW